MAHSPEPTDISPTDLKKREEDFHAESGELGRAFTKAVNDLEALGNFWGDDEVGQEFAGTSHGPPA
ncbi:hypothetical protein AB0G15_28310 [Streptosporangium sp. NPDC023825]|uniref:hypothetical protein n=1 Tax=Streptosporangium sp. NPDC023825 TaxID=3154909 RepID=UPI0034286E97